MRLPEKVMLRRYHALDYDWTPLSRNPCWLSNAAHHYSIYMKRNRFAWFHLRYYRQRFCEYHKLRCCSDKSFADDLVESGYCKCESSLVLRSTEVFPVFLWFVLPCWLWFFRLNLQILQKNMPEQRLVNLCSGEWLMRCQIQQGRTNRRNTAKTSVDRNTEITLALTVAGCN